MAAKKLRLALAGVLAGVTLALPALSAFGAPATVSATGECLAWFGARGEGICMGYSNGNPTYIGTPAVGVWGNGLGVSTGPLLPGQTITQGISP